MEDFYIILKDQDQMPDWQHPSILKAVSKKEAYALVGSNTPPEYIEAVLTKGEWQAKAAGMMTARCRSQSDLIDPQDLDSNESGAGFFNRMLQAGTSMGERLAEQSQAEGQGSPEVIQAETGGSVNSQLLQQPQDEVQPRLPQKPQAARQPMFFQDGEAQFKIEDSKVFKQCWEEIKTSDDFRIVYKGSDRLVKSDKYAIQRLVWKQIGNSTGK